MALLALYQTESPTNQLVMIFDNLNELLFTKQHEHMNNVDHETDYSPYMINRWISMHSPELATVINGTVNWMHQIFETKSDHYKFLHVVLPCVSRKRIQYIKKQKPDEPESEDKIDVVMLARNLQLSQREVKQMMDMS